MNVLKVQKYNKSRGNESKDLTSRSVKSPDTHFLFDFNRKLTQNCNIWLYFSAFQQIIGDRGVKRCV